MHYEQWPAIPYPAWSETLDALQRWTQMVGKVRLAHEPWLNHGWHVPLYVSARGLSTSLMHSANGAFEIEFDFVASELLVRSARHDIKSFSLEAMAVGSFHGKLKALLKEVGAEAAFDGLPNEMVDATPFALDLRERPFDSSAVRHWWNALVSIDRVFKRFRTSFVGKSSPVHFFWGSFDLAVTRFSGRPAPLHPGGVPNLPDIVAREAYDREVSSAGFWPGDTRYPEPAFYSYAYPSPDGFATADVGPADAFYSTDLGEWVLPYEAVRQSPDPEACLMQFLQSSFTAAASQADWDASLACKLGEKGRPRTPQPST